MISLKVCMLAVTGIAAAMILKQWRSDLLPLIRLAATLLLVQAVLSASLPVLALLRSLLGSNGLTDYAGVLMKALGVSLLTQTCANVCRECGEGGIADGVEWIGRVEILLLSLPLLERLLSLSGELLRLGGAS